MYVLTKAQLDVEVTYFVVATQNNFIIYIILVYVLIVYIYLNII